MVVMTPLSVACLFHVSPPLGPTPHAVFMLVPSPGAARGCSTDWSSWTRCCLFSQTPGAFSALMRNIRAVHFLLIFITFVLISVTHSFQKCWRQWRKLNSVAKGKNLISKYVSFSVAALYQNTLLGLLIYCSFLQSAEPASLWLLLLASVNSHVPHKKSFAHHASHKALQPLKQW